MHRYTQIKKIGAGSFGAAILCKHNSSGEKVVIKRIDIRDMGEEERKSAKKEATILSNLNHPCIIRQYESFEDEGFLCIVTEFAEKGDLNARMEERKGAALSENQALDYFTQLCLSLLYVHRKKILHRDLKLANVFVSADNTIRLGDFGIARILKYTMEAAKTVVGTPYYLSPEICANSPYNHKSDVWSLGCILYELCTGRHAFEATSINGLVRKIMKGKVDELPPSFSWDMRQAVASMLQVKPSLRPSVQQLLQLPFLQPYIRNFASRCSARGVAVPFIELTLPSAGSAVGEPPLGPLPPLPGTAAALPPGRPSPAPVRQGAQAAPSRQASPAPPVPHFGGGNGRGPSPTPYGVGVDPIPLPAGAEARYRVAAPANYAHAIAAAAAEKEKGDRGPRPGLPVRATPSALPAGADWAPPVAIPPYRPASGGVGAPNPNRPPSHHGQPSAAGEAWPRQHADPVPSAGAAPAQGRPGAGFLYNGKPYTPAAGPSAVPVRQPVSRSSRGGGSEGEGGVGPVGVDAHQWRDCSPTPAPLVPRQRTSTSAREMASAMPVPGPTTTVSPGRPRAHSGGVRDNIPTPTPKPLAVAAPPAPAPPRPATCDLAPSDDEDEDGEVCAVDLGPPEEEFVEGAQADEEEGEESEEELLAAADALLPHGMPLQVYKAAASGAAGGSKSSEGDTVLVPMVREFLNLKVDNKDKDPVPGSVSSEGRSGRGTMGPLHLPRAVVAGTRRLVIPGLPQAQALAIYPYRAGAGRADPVSVLGSPGPRGPPWPNSEYEEDSLQSKSGGSAHSAGSPGLGPGGESGSGDLEPESPGMGGVGVGYKFMMNGATLNLKHAAAKDPLTYRVECLRTYLLELLGEGAFLKLYRGIVDARRVDASVDLTRTVRKAVGEERKGLLPLVFQLIYCEEKAYGHN